MGPLRRTVVLAAGTLLLLAGAPAAPAMAVATGSRPIAAFLDLDRGFDRRADDFDVAERTIEHVLERRPDSRLGIVDRGLRRATGFLPTDRAFRRFVRALGGDGGGSEREVFREVAGLPVGVLESAMLYHVVVGRTLDADRLRERRGTRLRTAEGGTVRVQVRDGAITLVDDDPDSPDAQVVRADLNDGNRHVAHGVDRVLRYLDIP